MNSLASLVPFFLQLNCTNYNSIPIDRVTIYSHFSLLWFDQRIDFVTSGRRELSALWFVSMRLASTMSLAIFFIFFFNEGPGKLLNWLRTIGKRRQKSRPSMATVR